MLNDLAATVENFQPLLQDARHAMEHGPVFETRNGADDVRASRASGSHDRLLDYRNRLWQVRSRPWWIGVNAFPAGQT
jgi:hypothetical protein